MARRELLISFDVDEQGAIRDIKAVRGQIGRLDKDLTGVTKTGQGFGITMKGVLAGITVAGAALAIRSLSRLARRGFQVLHEAVNLAGIQQIAERKLETAIRNLGLEAEPAMTRLKALAAETQKLSNFGDEQILTAQAMLLSFRAVAGPAGAELLTQSLVDMAAGMAKTSGETVDLNQVAITLGKAIEGGAGALSRYGISLSETQRAALDSAEGLERVALIAEIIDDNFGGLAEATADPMKQLQNSVGDLKEVLGAELRPEVERATRALIAFVEDPDVQQLVREIGTDLVTALNTVTGFLQNNAHLVTQFFEGFKIVANLTPIIQLARLNAKFLSLGSKTAADLDDTLKLLTSREVADLLRTPPEPPPPTPPPPTSILPSITPKEPDEKEDPFAQLELARAAEAAEIALRAMNTELAAEDELLEGLTGRVDTFSDRLHEALAVQGVQVVAGFTAALVGAFTSAEAGAHAVAKALVLLLADVAQNLAQLLLAEAAAAAIGGLYVKAARLAAAAGVLMGIAGAIRSGVDTSDGQPGYLSRGTTSAVSGAVSGRPFGSGAASGTVEFKVHGRELRGVLVREDAAQPVRYN